MTDKPDGRWHADRRTILQEATTNVSWTHRRLVSKPADYERRDRRSTKTPQTLSRPSPRNLRWQHVRSRGVSRRATASVFPRRESEAGVTRGADGSTRVRLKPDTTYALCAHGRAYRYSFAASRRFGMTIRQLSSPVVVTAGRHAGRQPPAQAPIAAKLEIGWSENSAASSLPAFSMHRHALSFRAVTDGAASQPRLAAGSDRTASESRFPARSAEGCGPASRSAVKRHPSG